MDQPGNRNIAFAISAVLLLSMLTVVIFFPRADSLSPSIVFVSADSEVKQVPDGNDISFMVKFHNNHQNSSARSSDVRTSACESDQCPAQYSGGNAQEEHA